MAEVAGATLETVSGKFVNVLDPNPDDILMDDIGWSLSRMSRFCGHTVTTVPYTVGQHSIFVAQMLRKSGSSPKVQLFGLLHDSAEFLIGDIPSPVKRIPEFRKYIDVIEDKILNVIYEKFVGEAPHPIDWQKVKKFDHRAQFIEAHAFMVSRGREWSGRDEFNISLVELQTFPQPSQAIETYEYFMEYYETLSNEVKYGNQCNSSERNNP